MRRSMGTLAAIGVALAIGSTGCGGGGGSSSGGGNSGGGTGGSLSASMTLLSGALASTAAAGSTSNIQLADGGGNLHTIGPVYSPDALGSQSLGTYGTVIRAGSTLLSGHYTSTTAKYVNANENFSSTIPLTSAGALAKDTFVPDFDGAIVLPIDKIGNYSFPNGIAVTFRGGINHYSVQNNSLAFTATIPAKGGPTANAGQLTFTDTGTVSPQCAMHLAFASTDGLSGVIIQTPSSTNGVSPCPLQGEAAGSDAVMTGATIVYDLED